MKERLLNWIRDPLPLHVILLRKIARCFSIFSYQELLAIGALDRSNYGYCIFQAAKLASALRYPAISVLELGCAGGNGLLHAEKHIKEVRKIFPVDIELYGFDTGEGLPAPKDYRDLPYWFKSGLYAMDRSSLDAAATFAK